MSLSSEMIDIIIGRFNNRSMYKNKKTFEKWLEKKAKDNEKPFRLIYPFSNLITVEKMKIDGMRYYVLNRKNCKKTIFYYHGGAYISRPVIMHWRFVESVLLKTDVCVVFPIYPRLPKHTCDDCLNSCVKLYNNFLKNNNVKEVIFMGDSAGGGLALTMTQQVKNKTEKRIKTIMLSPWVDTITNNKESDEIQKTDKMLSKKGLHWLGEMWSNNDEKNVIANPIWGDLKKGDLTLIIGTNDLLYPDAKVLVERAELQDVNINYHVYKGMCHCFILMPTPEANNALKIVLDEINRIPDDK